MNVQMELCTGGPVSACLARLPRNAFLPPLGWRFAHDVAAGLAHIHSARLLHLDIKPENIFLTGAEALSAPSEAWRRAVAARPHDGRRPGCWVGTHERLRFTLF